MAAKTGLGNRMCPALAFGTKTGGQERPFRYRLVVDNTRPSTEARKQLAKVLENRENGAFTPW